MKSQHRAEDMFTLGGKPSTLAGAAAPADTVAGGYTMIPQKFYHTNASRNALGLVGGNEVSLASGNLVDVESDLRGVTRDLTNCPERQYQPSCALGQAGAAPAPANAPAPFNGGTCAPWPTALVIKERGTGRVVTVSTAPRHLPTTQFASYPGVPAPEPFKQEVYGAPWRF
jgi:hypothetical protein